MKVNPEMATETLLKYLLYLNIFLFGFGFFYEYGRKTVIIILLFNVLMLLLRQGIKKESNNIMYRGKHIG